MLVDGWPVSTSSTATGRSLLAEQWFGGGCTREPDIESHSNSFKVIIPSGESYAWKDNAVGLGLQPSALHCHVTDPCTRSGTK